MTDRQVIAAIRKNHLKANIDQFEKDPTFWGRPVWSQASLDPGGTIFGDGPYAKVPIKGGEWDGTRQRVYPPARLRRRLARLWHRRASDVVCSAAVSWWLGRRPLAFDQAQHLANPTINTCTETEKALAQAVAALVAGVSPSRERLRSAASAGRTPILTPKKRRTS